MIASVRQGQSYHVGFSGLEVMSGRRVVQLLTFGVLAQAAVTKHHSLGGL